MCSGIDAGTTRTARSRHFLPRVSASAERLGLDKAAAAQGLVRKETPSLAFLPSLHGDSASYEVQTTVEHLILYETAHLEIEISDARSGRVVWSSSADRRVRGRFLPRADRTISELLAEFPPPLQAAL